MSPHRGVPHRPAQDTAPLLHLDSVTSTVLFRRSAEGLQQAVDVALTLPESCSIARLHFRRGARQVVIDLPHLPAGTSTCRVFIPDLRRAQPVTFSLFAGGALQHELTLDWHPQPHWQLHLVQSSHHDLGYTDLPSNVLRQHDQFLDDALDFCDQTDAYPADSRFHYVIEQAWSLQHYLEHRPSRQVRRLVRRLRQGRIELTALMGNQTTELCGAEELVRLLYPAFCIRRQYRVPILTAELNDIPGIAWGLSSVLAGAGIRYFAPGIPDYFAWGRKVRPYWDEQAVLPRNMKGAFWWEGPDGQRVLLWYEGGGISTLDLWDLDQAERDLPTHLQDLSARGYPFPLARIKLTSAVRDNSPAVLRYCQLARQWNERWAYPRLVISTSARFFQAFEALAGSQLRVLRGEMPNTDYTIGAASTPLETGVNRLAHDQLLSAEKLAAWASLASGEDYPAEVLRQASDCMLLFDEHTWGMAHPIGAAQQACWSQKRELAWRAAALAQDVLVKSANRLADFLRLDQSGYHAVVFNPLGWQRSGMLCLPASPPAACSRPLYWRQPAEGSDQPPTWVNGTALGRDLLSLPPGFFEQPYHLLELPADGSQPPDASLRSVPYQVVRVGDPLAARPLAASRFALGNIDPTSASVLNYDRTQLYDVFFQAQQVPALGYRAYRFVSADQPPQFETNLRVSGCVIENRFYRLRLDEHTGAVVSIFDKELRQELVDPSAAHQLNQLLVRFPRNGETVPAGSAQVLPGAEGPLFASLVVQSIAPGCPQITQEIVLYDSVRRIDFFNRILRDSNPLLEVYFAFPFAVPRPRFRYEASRSVIAPIDDQLPGTNTAAYAVQHWVSVSNADLALTWCSLEAPVAALGELWPLPVSQAHHGITPHQYDADFLRSSGEYQHGYIYSYAAIHNFRTNFSPVQAVDCLYRYSLTSRAPDSSTRPDWRFGWEMGTPLEPVLVSAPQPGVPPAVASFCQVEPGNIHLLALKQAEDGRGWILRLAEMEGIPTHAVLTLPLLEVQQAELTNLVEEGAQPLEFTPHRIEVEIPANGMLTVRVIPVV
jgi:hypothetical protein